jgi:hypothetical protein
MLKIHSVIDVITNSSTEIFCGCHSNTKNEFKKFVEVILKESGCDKSFDDLFELEEKWDETYLEDLKHEYDLENPDEKEEYEKRIKELLKNDSYDYYNCKKYLHLKIKNSGKDLNVTDNIKKIFDIDEYET